MKKRLKQFSIFAAILIALWVIARITGTFQSYKVSSSSMEPSIKVGSRFFATNLKKPERNSIIVIKRIATEKDGPERVGQELSYTYRLIAFGGETLEIKNDLAYVNGELIDDSTKLMFQYKIKKEDIEKIATILTMDIDDNNSFQFNYSSENGDYIMHLPFKELNKIKNIITAERVINNEILDFLYNPDSKNWTVSNYGPIRIPKDHYFVLGDNRSQSADSRFHGPIPTSDWVGTVLW